MDSDLVIGWQLGNECELNVNSFMIFGCTDRVLVRRKNITSFAT